uniref:Uncharacterized protein n=1 Tax=Brassica campestris TaxID=3711 RepID=M4F8F8_BRACM
MAMTVAASTSVAVSPPSLTFLRYLLALLADHLSPLKLVSGLEILAFPCNQEEPGTTDPITDFVCTRFKSEFPIFHKVQTARQILYKFYVL